jgi:hypothetical protein
LPPTTGQANYQQNPTPQAQPLIRPPVNPGIRQGINPNQQQPPIRNITPITGQPIRPPLNPNQPQFRPPPQQQQQFQRPNFPNQVPLEQQPQFRPQAPPINLQRQPIPEQKIIRNQNPNMMSEINRERTFTTSHEGSREASMDDDDDVVVGRMVTPQMRPVAPDQRPPMGNVPVPVQMQQQRPMPPPQLQRRESQQSIPSRPPSGLGSNNSQSPEPRMNPPMPVQQQQFTNRIDPTNRNVVNEMTRQSPNNYDYTRESMEANDKVERVQRPLSQVNNGLPQQRQSPDDVVQRHVPPRTNQPPIPQPPLQQQFKPAPPPASDMYARQNPIDQKKSQPEQQNLQNNPTQRMQQQKFSDGSKSAEPQNQNRKNSVRLDLSKSDQMKSPNDKSPSSKKEHIS